MLNSLQHFDTREQVLHLCHLKKNILAHIARAFARMKESLPGPTFHDRLLNNHTASPWQRRIYAYIFGSLEPIGDQRGALLVRLFPAESRDDIEWPTQ